MAKFSVTILGCGSAKPTLRHQTSSQIINHSGSLYLVDCGEGTQNQLMRFKIRQKPLENIFISHAHSDHCLGLVGLLSSMALNERRKSLRVFCPSDLEAILKANLAFFLPRVGFDILIHPIDSDSPTLIYSDKLLEVTAFPLIHRVPCYGFLFKERSVAHIRPECIRQYGIPFSAIEGIRCGDDFLTTDGRRIPNSELVSTVSPVRSYAYLTDTRPMPAYTELLRGADLIYHDATYAAEDAALAQQYTHSTAAEAAVFAGRCHAKQLLLGHYSSRYEDETVLLAQAREIFPDTLLSDEGLTVDIGTEAVEG